MLDEIIIYMVKETYYEASKKLAQQLNLPLQKNIFAAQKLILYYDEKKCLCLKQLGEDAPTKPIFVNFSAAKLKHRIQHSSHKQEAIAKAVGIKSKNIPTILDATAGLGRDAFILASFGCSITMIEHSPIIAALLEDGLLRGSSDPDITDIIKRMHLIKTDCIEYMHKKDLPEKPDVVYLDPMFPTRKKTALVKKEMRILSTLLKQENKPDENKLLDAAIQFAKKRVVVKRPRLSNPIANHKPNFSIKGKACRFDVYLT